MGQGRYSAADIELLKGLDPVRKRPGMYTDTACPNHLLYEVVDNSVDEALAGHATEIVIELQEDGCGACVIMVVACQWIRIHVRRFRG